MYLFDLKFEYLNFQLFNMTQKQIPSRTKAVEPRFSLPTVFKREIETWSSFFSLSFNLISIKTVLFLLKNSFVFFWIESDRHTQTKIKTKTCFYSVQTLLSPQLYWNKKVIRIHIFSKKLNCHGQENHSCSYHLIVSFVSCIAKPQSIFMSIDLFFTHF